MLLTFVIRKSDVPFMGAVLSDEGDEWTGDPARWILFASAVEASLTSFGLPGSSEVVPLGAAFSGRENSYN